jgi:DNA-binding NtrC family response regulator
MEPESSLIGNSSFVGKLRKEIGRLGKLDRHVLLVGERGTGKATIARLLHAQAAVKGSWIALDPVTSTEMEFQDALKSLRSKSATVFIREVEEFSFLQQAEIQKIVEQAPSKPFNRIIVSIKTPAREAYRRKVITENLYNSLTKFETVGVPPLSQRTDDIPLLVEHFIKKTCDRVGVRLKAIDINTIDFLTKREWKENIAELRSVLEKAVVSSEDQVIELPEYVRDEQAQVLGMLGFIRERKPFAFDNSLANLERSLIEKALEVSGYNQSKAARILNLSEANFRYRLKKFRISPPEEE